MSDADPIRLEYLDGGVALVTLDRPEVLNAINTAMGVRLDEVMAELAERKSVRVVVVTGAGERAFSAGGDLKERQGMTPDAWGYQHRIFEHANWRVRNLKKPIFSAVNGVAVGGGCELAMSTDFIIAADHARFGQPEVTRGIMPGGGGLVNRVVPRGELLEEALGLATTIAANSPGAVQQAKRSAKLGLEAPIEQAIEIELECYQRMVDHPDRHEGVNAFNEGRRPVEWDPPPPPPPCAAEAAPSAALRLASHATCNWL